MLWEKNDENVCTLYKVGSFVNCDCHRRISLWDTLVWHCHQWILFYANATQTMLYVINGSYSIPVVLKLWSTIHYCSGVQPFLSPGTPWK
jgi:hypothetical protein